jgi:hypothetical protein
MDIKPEANAEVKDAKAPVDEVEAKTSSSTEARLLEESKRYKSRLQETKKELEELRSKLEASKQSELAEQGKYKDLWQKESESKKQWVEKYVQKTIKTAVVEAATKAGCIDPEAVYMMGNLDLVEFDTENHTVDGVEVLIEEYRKQKPQMFGSQKKTVIHTTIPQTVEEKPRTVKDMSLTDKLEAFKKIRASELHRR